MLVYPGKLGPGGPSLLVCITRSLSPVPGLLLGACWAATASSASWGGGTAGAAALPSEIFEAGACICTQCAEQGGVK